MIFLSPSCTFVAVILSSLLMSKNRERIDMERKSYINPVNDNDLKNIIPELIYKISQKQKIISKLSSEIEEDKKQIMLGLYNAKQIGYTDKEIRERIGIIII
jgi:hypothetical protein